MRIGGIYVDIGARTKTLKRDLDKAKGMSKKAAVLMRQELGRIGFRQAAFAATAFAAVFAIAMKKSIDAASDLEETASKFAVVFAGQTERAEQHAQTLVDSYAMSTREAKHYLSSIQDLLIPMGVAADKAGLLSNEVVKLSADLGSFNNLPTEQVMLDIQSALVGNFETMKKYGVVLNATVVQEKALAMGLANTKKELNAGHKAQAAYALMVEGSKAAIGDMERTSGSYANQVKQLKANIEDMAATIGDRLLPQISLWLKHLNTMLKDNPQIAKDIGDFAENVLTLATNIGGAVGKAISFANVWVKTWQALGLAAAGQISFTDALTNGAALVDEFNEKIRQQNESLIINKQAKEEAAAAGGAAPEAQEVLTAEEELEFIKSALERRWTMEEDAANRLMALEDARIAQTAKAEAEITALKQQSAKSQTAILRGLFTAGLQLAGVEGKKLFAIQKAIDVGMAVMSAYKASAMALAHPPGPPTTIPLASMVLKAGLLSAAAIAATAIGQIGAGSAGAAGGGTHVSPTITETEIPLLDEEPETRGTVTINIQGDFIGDEAYIDLLVDRINAAEDRDVFINQTNFAAETL